MTREEFTKIKFYHGIKAKYKGRVYGIQMVDFEEDLIGLDKYDPNDSFCEPITWVRCENCEIIETEQIFKFESLPVVDFPFTLKARQRPKGHERPYKYHR